MTLAVIQGQVEGHVLTRVEEIIRLEAQADRMADEADRAKWEAARLIAEEVQSGKSLRKLAGEIGKSHQHVDRMKRCWEVAGCHLKVTDRPAFNHVYNSAEVRGTDKKVHDKVPQFGTIEEMADVFTDNPEQAEMVKSALKRALDRAREKVRDRVDADPGHQRNKQAYDTEKSTKLIHNAMRAVRQFTEMYRPESRESGERMAGALESAAAIIRQRIAGMEE